VECLCWRALYDVNYNCQSRRLEVQFGYVPTLNASSV